MKESIFVEQVQTLALIYLGCALMKQKQRALMILNILDVFYVNTLSLLPSNFYLISVNLREG